MLGCSKKRVRLMKIDGETLQLKAPLKVQDVVQQYPNHVVLDSELVRTLGTKARPLDANYMLKSGAKKLYFLVELPKLPEGSAPRRVRWGIHMGAKERLESLMLAKRSASDLTFTEGGGGGEEGFMRVKMRLPKSQVTKLVQEGAHGAEVAEKIVELCLNKKEEEKEIIVGNTAAGAAITEGRSSGNLGAWNSELGRTQEGGGGNTIRQKRTVRFQPVQELI